MVGWSESPILNSVEVKKCDYPDGPGVQLKVEFDLPSIGHNDIRAIGVRCNGSELTSWSDFTKRKYSGQFRSNGGSFHVSIFMKDHCGNMWFSNEIVTRLSYQSGSVE